MKRDTERGKERPMGLPSKMPGNVASVKLVHSDTQETALQNYREFGRKVHLVRHQRNSPGV